MIYFPRILLFFIVFYFNFVGGKAGATQLQMFKKQCHSQSRVISSQTSDLELPGTKHYKSFLQFPHTHSIGPNYTISQINPVQINSLPLSYREVNPRQPLNVFKKLHTITFFTKDVNLYFKSLMLHFYFLNKEGTALSIYPLKHLA